jgi:hypothetical protein
MMKTQDMKAIAGSQDLMFLCVLRAGSEAMQSMAVPNVLLRQISAAIYGSGRRSEGTLLTALLAARGIVILAMKPCYGMRYCLAKCVGSAHTLSRRYCQTR